jgi:hypothetical protein
MSVQLLGRVRSPAIAIALTSLAVLPGIAQADFISCPTSFIADGTAKVHDGSGAPLLTAVNDCQYITPPDENNVASEGNLQGFFGFNDWDVWDNSVLQVNANASSGTWVIPDVDFAAFDYMITFKSGAETNLVSFLFNELFASGGWDTPFTEPPFEFAGAVTSRNVSHYTISRREDGDGGGPPALIPEPGTLALLGLGMLSLGLVATRSKG